jgi:hypothetical protein
VIETENEPSPSVKPVINQGFKLKPSLCINELIFLGSFVFVEYKRLFRI